MFLSSNELDLRKVTEWSAKSWQLSAVARRRRKTVVRVFFIPSPMTGHIMRPLLNGLCEQCPYLSSNCLWSLLSLLSHLKWTRERRCPVAVAICTKQHIFSLVQQHPCLVVVPLLILLLYKFYPKSKTKITSVPSLSLSYACTHAHTHTYTCNQKHTVHNPHTHTHTHTQKE